MYNFIDVNEVSDGASLPSEALRINGEYIENLIEGYRTLTVSGREALSPDVYSIETGSRDGTRLQKKRYPERIIVVQYRLSAKSNEAFREAYNKLGRILDVEEAELIFEDEKDKYFIGTPCIIGSVDPGKNTVVGEFEILCTDPFKYSVEEYEATSDGTAITIDYNGTYKSYPTLVSEFYNEAENGETDVTLTGAGDCGHVAFFNEREKIIQFGDPEELDGETHKKSQTLINQTFLSATSWGATAKKLWTLNSAIAFPHNEAQLGNVTTVKSYPGASENEYFLVASDYGTGSTRCGVSITRQIGADAAGDVGASNFTLSYRHKFCPAKGGKNEVGIFYAYLVSETDTVVAGVRISKYSVGDYAGKVNFYVNNEMVKEVPFDMTFENAFFGDNGNQHSVIKKTGNTVNFNLGGIKRSFNCYDDGFADLKATEVTFFLGKYGNYKALTYNGLFWAKFVKNNCTTFSDIPNKFSASDVLTVDCKNGEVYLNGLNSPEFGALGNDWEKFYLTPGINVIDTTYSNWVDSDHAPSFKVRYREVFL